ncbi:MAG: DUF4040 domain-containing protein [Cyanophyceae cyanobacterium]
MIESYIYVIVALLPLAALILVFQVNPYHALVIRAILGAVAALVYAVLGAADVALTEALVGTMLAITLYVVAVRSSLVMRLGILSGGAEAGCLAELIACLRKITSRHHLRLELVKYSNPKALEQALLAKEVHAICTESEQAEADGDRQEAASVQYESVKTPLPSTFASDHRAGESSQLAVSSDRTQRLAIRVRRLFEIMQTELTSPETVLTYITVANVEDKH